MEFFILTLVGRVGLRSLYELRRRAGLEPGGIRSAMKSLETERLILRTDPGKRRRRNLALTAAGSAVLEHSWTYCLREYPGADAVLRAAFVGWVMGGPSAAASYLERMGASCREKAQQNFNESEHLKSLKSEPLSSYAWMRFSNEAHRRSAESVAFLSMSRFIEESFSKNAPARQSQAASLE
jgi:DNA-binding MarR family transcriptional regulator